MNPSATRPLSELRGILKRLAADTAGNTLMLIAAALLPILALVGGSVDLGRSYLSQSRLQQACDSGVLAARKRLGTEAVVTGVIPTAVNDIGHAFFESNFRDGAYGTENRHFEMTLEDDFGISGVATLDVPTTVMTVFGFDEMPISVSCEANLSMSNTDIMMVLDVTGSMSQTNVGDEQSRIDTMRDTVRNFHAQLTGGGESASRLRFGFLPYSTNVNVGGILEDDWVVDSWDYQSRTWDLETTVTSTRIYWQNWAYVSGSKSEYTVESTYPATWHPPGSGGGAPYLDENENLVYPPAGEGYYTCDTAAPENTYTSGSTLTNYAEEPFLGPPPGTRKIWSYRFVQNGSYYWLSRSDSTCRVMASHFYSYTYNQQKVQEPAFQDVYKWHYRKITGKDVSNWRTETAGCMEERDTYEITNYNNVNLSQALDLDLNSVPTNADRTKWRPMYPDLIFARSIRWDGSGSFQKNPVWTYDDYVGSNALGVASCPAPARRLAEISAEDLDTYLNSLVATGQTYHDIGMIWGGRMLSPTGLFADANADVDTSTPTSRHLIFLTDGETAPLDLAYSSYGLEPLDERRWKIGSAYTLTQTVEKRFSFACNEVKNMNATVWIIGFGTSLSDVMTDCAGEGHFFEAANADQLNEVFNEIAKSIAELRVTD